MPTIETADTVVVGAGVIGLAVALARRSEGREVVIVDPNAPGSGASFGNAGTVAAYGCIPVGTPAVLKNLPRLLGRADSPLSLPLTALPGIAPWLLRFALASMPQRASAGAASLAALLGRSLDHWQRLWEATGSSDLVRNSGCLYLYERASPPRPGDFDIRTREALGVRQQFVTAAEVATMEPALAPLQRGGIFFPDAAHICDPAELMRRLAAAAQAAGVVFVCGTVSTLCDSNGKVLLRGHGLRLQADHVVIAAGAHSRALAAQAGDNVPLDTERGYHVEYPMKAALLSRPVCPVELGFYMTPMAGRLRVAGTVEFGGVARAPNVRRFELLDRGAHRMLPGLGDPASRWLGFRPSMPDSLPVIGRASGVRNVVHAFGHGHLGLTLAAVTGTLVADLLAGRAADPLVAPFSPQRYMRSRRRKRALPLPSATQPGR